jgi:hypothetical protein
VCLLAISLTNYTETKFKESLTWLIMITIIEYCLLINLQVNISLMPANGILPGPGNPSLCRKNLGDRSKLPPFYSEAGFVLTVINHQVQRYTIIIAVG